jgi:hypothetical protein
MSSYFLDSGDAAPTNAWRKAGHVLATQHKTGTVCRAGLHHSYIAKDSMHPGSSLRAMQGKAPGSGYFAGSG